MTVPMPALQGRWCPACGVAVDWGERVCPNCGLPLEQEWGSSSPDVQTPIDEMASAGVPAPEPVVDDAADTHAIPRIESAIPPEDDPTSRVAVQEAIPRTSRFLVAAVASAALVCGLALAITHPWNPDVYSIKATEEADTSMAGFPGTVETLTGQDSDGRSEVEVPTGDDATLAQLTEAYGKLGRYAARADANEELFGEVAFENDLTERTRGKREADALAIDVSNLIQSLEKVDVSSGTYVDELEHMNTLGNWLRNRMDTLTAAWKAVVESDNPAADRARLEQLLLADHGDDGKSAYQTLFDENYEQWEPKKHDS